MKLERRSEKGSKIRKDKLIPGIFYGKGIESTPIQTTQEDFRREYNKYGNTKTFKVEFEGKSHIVYIKTTQPTFANFHLKQHFDLVKVAADDTMTNTVYVKYLNKNEVKKRGLVIQSILDEVEIEYPVGSGISHLDLDVTGLNDHDTVKAGQIVLPKGIKLLTDPESVVLAVSVKREYSLDDIATDGEEVTEVEYIKQPND